LNYTRTFGAFGIITAAVKCVKAEYSLHEGPKMPNQKQQSLEGLSGKSDSEFDLIHQNDM